MSDAVTNDVSEAIDTSEALTILDRLCQAFRLAEKVLKSEAVGRIWVVSGVVGCMPVIQTVPDINALCLFITNLRKQQSDDSANRYFLFIFFGNRWTLRKGRTWQIWDGQHLTDIKAEAVVAVDDDGSLTTSAEFDRVLSAAAEVGELIVGDTVSTGASTLINDGDDELAPPGEDPVIFNR